MEEAKELKREEKKGLIKSGAKYEYEFKDYLQLSLWYLPLFIFIGLWGWLWGLFCYYILTKFVAQQLKYFHNIELMTGGD